MNLKERKVSLVLVVVFIALCTVTVGNARANGEGSHGLQVKTPFMSVLTFGQVPNPEEDAIVSNASGMFFGYLNHLTNELHFSITYRDLRGQLDKAHFHGPAPAGVVNADHYFDICCREVDPYKEQPEGPIGTFNGKTRPLTVFEILDLMNGLWYINIHSDLYDTGEIRGQVIPTGVNYLLLVP